MGFWRRDDDSGGASDRGAAGDEGEVGAKGEAIMSDRTWLGPEEKEWADHNLCKYPTMKDLCEAAAWKLPAKAFSPTRELMVEFLAVMEENHNMTWDDFWKLSVGDEGRWEDYANTPTRAEIEVMEMFGNFVKDVNKSGGM